MMARAPSDDTGTWLLSLPATARQSWLAVVVAGILLLAVTVLGPFAKIPLTRFDSFIPAFEGTIFVTDLLTSVLLFSQFSIYRSYALYVLACGYLFSALTLPAHGLTFPGAFSPGGLLGAGLQSTAWIYWFWHYGFVLVLLAYGLLRDVGASGWIGSAPVSAVIGGSAAVVAALAGGSILLATAGNDLMPRLAVDRVNIAPVNHIVGAGALLLCVSALAVLWVRRRSVLDQWLMVVAVAAMSELGLAVLFTSARYSLGFYAGRIFSFLASTIVLVVLLAATTRLYAGVARANMLLQRERDNKLMNIDAVIAAIAHQLKQPLTAIAFNIGAASQFLRQGPPDLDEVRKILARTERASHWASDVFDSIRSLFRRLPQHREPIDLNRIALDVLQSLRHELRDHGVTVETELASALPAVNADARQLQQVILILANNAIEAMDAVKDQPRTLRLRSEQSSSREIGFAVEDTGPGIDPEQIERIFDVFVTTKAQGMGLGLAICRMVIEGHDGKLTASSDGTSGAILRFVLPIRPAG